MVIRSLTLTGEQIRAARALGRIEQAELARRSGLSLETIKRLERIRGPVEANSRTLTAIAGAFGAMSIEFDAGDSVGVRLLGRSVPEAPPRPMSTSGGAVRLMHRLIYYSRIAPELEPRMKAIADDVLAASLRRNGQLGVTGALLASNGRFLQVIEGEKEAVMQVYGAIALDPRHAELHIVESRPVASRQFPDWNLCCGVFPADGDLFLQEPAMKEGFRPEALTPASALGLLSVMRDLKRESPRTARTPTGPCPLAGECLDHACVRSAA